MLFWHYTTGVRFDSILTDGVILPATDYTSPDEVHVVWFSREQFWERTAEAAWRNPDGTVVALDMRDCYVHGGGLARLGVSSSKLPWSWSDYRAKARVDPRILDGLAEAAKDKASRPSWWRCHPGPMQLSMIERIDKWDGAKWQPMSAETIRRCRKDATP